MGGYEKALDLWQVGTGRGERGEGGEEEGKGRGLSERVSVYGTRARRRAEGWGWAAIVGGRWTCGRWAEVEF